MISPFHEARLGYAPRYPKALHDASDLHPTIHDEAVLAAAPDQIATLKTLFPKTWGQKIVRLGSGTVTKGEKQSKGHTAAVVLSGGQAPGGHNVIWGLVEGLTSHAKDSRIIGFRAGPGGILDDRHVALTPEVMANYRNTGGFDLLGSGRTKIEKPEQYARCKSVLELHGVDTLVIIGGDDSNTNAACLAEYFLAHGSKTRVVGVPKTIDGDLKNQYVETSFGFDTAVRVYAELVANIARDALSARKYYHFVRLMGRSASHITLETALQTQPNIALVSEEIERRGLSLRQVVEEIGAVIKARANEGKNFGVVLVPEGLVEFIPDVKRLLGELNQILGEHHEYVDSLSGFTAQSEYVHRKLSRDASYTFSSMPINIQRQLLMDRDPHGNVQVSRIETEKLLIEMLESYLGEAKAEGHYHGKFGWQHHFLGYEGRCAAPTNFDADYAYALGRTAAALVAAEVTGYMAVVTNLTADRDAWDVLGVPLVSMMNLEMRRGRSTPVIKKTLVDLSSRAFTYFAAQREAWALGDYYRFAGPIQYFGPPSIVDRVPLTLALESNRERAVAW